MKLYNYYKLEENKFCRLVETNDNVLDYDTIYCFSEQEQQPHIPEALRTHPHVIYGGSGFTHNVYVPFSNDIIDYTLPSVAVYQNLLKNKYQAGISYKDIETFLDSTYYRMFAGNALLPIPPIRRNRRVYIYDTDFFQEGWHDRITEIHKHGPSVIYTIHPIICKKISNYFNLRSYEKMSRASEIILDITVPYDEIPYLLKKYKHLLLADINKNNPVFLSIGGDQLGKYAYYSELIYKLNLLYSFWAAGIPIKIYYRKPHFGYTNPFPELCLAIEKWTRQIARLDYNRTINDTIIFKSKKIQTERDQAKELFQKYPEAKDLFEQTFSDLKQRRYWKL